jgi:hypothetical protein
MNRTERLTKILIASLLLVTFLGSTAFLGRDVTYLPFAPTVQQDVPKTCVGKERWAIKTGTDSQAGQVKLAPVQSSIAKLVQLTAPKPLPEDKRITPTEFTIFTITATLIGYIKEDDQDYHLVLSDGELTMIVELPDPKCVGEGSPFLDQIKSVRKKFDQQFSGKNKPSGNFRTIEDGGIQVLITGVGFFDKLHGQRGVAPNGIELHPVTDIDFNPASPSTTTTLPSMSEVNVVKWEYFLITAKSAEDLRDALNPIGEEGWELVDVLFDPKRPEPYVAYLKRQKE